MSVNLTKAQIDEFLYQFNSFQDIDLDKNGCITKDELQQSMHKKGVKLPAEELEAMFKMADTNGDGKISLEEFLKVVARAVEQDEIEEKEVNASAKEAPAKDVLAKEAKVKRTSAKEAPAKGASAKEAPTKEAPTMEQWMNWPAQLWHLMEFQEFDWNKIGYITKDELKQGLLKMGKDVSEEVVDELIKMADKDGDGKINIDKFLKAVADEVPAN